MVENWAAPNSAHLSNKLLQMEQVSSGGRCLSFTHTLCCLSLHVCHPEVLCIHVNECISRFTPCIGALNKQQIMANGHGLMQSPLKC